MRRLFNTAILKNGFVKGSVTLMLGAGLSQAIPVIFSIFLARLYQPEQFGDLAIFTALCYIVGMISTGTYELTVMLPDNDRQAYQLLTGLTFLSGIVSCILALIIFFVKFAGVEMPGYANYLPFGVFFTGLFQGYTYWLNRKKKYIFLSLLRLIQSIGIVLPSLIIGIFFHYREGLIVGYLIGFGVAVLPLMVFLFKKRNITSFGEVVAVLKKYKNYPKVILPTSLLNTTSSYAPVLAITKFYSKTTVGFYSMTQRVLTAPVSIISSVIGQIYYQRIASQKKSIRTTFFTTSGLLTILSVIIFVPLLMFGQQIIVLLFGQQWLSAGIYLTIICWSTMVKFVVSPLSTILLVTNNEKKLAFWQTCYFITTIGIFIVGANFNIITMLWIYTFHEIVMYLFYYVIMINCINQL